MEALRPGDRVLTRDDGAAEILWTGRHELSLRALARAPDLRPVLIRAGALGPGQPARDLAVSPRHRLLISASAGELIFGAPEVLVPAVHLVGRPGIQRLGVGRPVGYVHFLCASHQIVLSDGAWSESYQPGPRALDSMAAGTRAEVLRLFPDLRNARHSYPAARPEITGQEARLVTW